MVSNSTAARATDTVLQARAARTAVRHRARSINLPRNIRALELTLQHLLLHNMELQLMARARMDRRLPTKVMISTVARIRDRQLIRAHKADQALNHHMVLASNLTMRLRHTAKQEDNHNTVAVVVNNMVKANPQEVNRHTSLIRPTAHHHSKPLMAKEHRNTRLPGRLTASNSNRTKCTAVPVTEAEGRATALLRRRDRLPEDIPGRDSTGVRITARDTVARARISMVVDRVSSMAVGALVSLVGREGCRRREMYRCWR